MNSEKKVKSSFIIWFIIAIILSAAIFFVIEKYLEFSELGEHWQSTSALLAAIIGIPAAVVGSIVALLLAISALSISKAQRRSEVVSALREEINLTLSLFDMTSESIHRVLTVDRDIRNYLGRNSKKGFNSKIPIMADEHTVRGDEIDDTFAKLCQDLRESQSSLINSLLKLLQNKIALDCMSIEEERRGENLCYHYSIEKIRESDSGVYFRKRPQEKYTAYNYFIDCISTINGDDSSFMSDEEIKSISINLIYLSNIVRTSIESDKPGWSTTAEGAQLLKVFNAGGKIIYIEDSVTSIINLGAIMIIDLLSLFPTSITLEKALIAFSKDVYSFDDLDPIKHMIKGIEPSALIAALVPVKSGDDLFKKNFSRVEVHQRSRNLDFS